MVKEVKNVPKILVFNGSPHRSGNTSIALKEVIDVLTAEGIETELIQLGGVKITPCMGCRKCWEIKDGKCIINSDIVNDLIAKMKESDGFIIGSPVYTSNVTAEVKAFMDRTNFVAKANGNLFKGKIGAAVVVATKTGATFAYSAINFMFGISQMITVGSTYWNSAFGKYPGDILDDVEGIESLHVLGSNIAELIKMLDREENYG